MKMKFHYLARQSQLLAGANQQQQQAAAAQQLTRDMSPIKQQVANQRQQNFHQHHQLTANSNNNNNYHSDADDDADDEDFVNDNQAFYDSLTIEQHQQQNQLHNQHHGQPAGCVGAGQTAASGQLDSSGFLMDKNKKLFPQKLWELIHNPSIQHCLRWSQDGQRVYLNRNEFETYYLKTPNNQFHTQKAISFVRQMNMYGFRKVDDCYYENDNFRRDRQHLLKNMIRRHPNKGLFAGLDHHHLAAAAAAQQAIQVNQQLQQLEQQHKHRAEQALRLNSYLNQHQFHHHHHQSATHQQLKQQHHSSPFEHMSSQLAQAAVSHLTQQHQQHLNENLTTTTNNQTNQNQNSNNNVGQQSLEKSIMNSIGRNGSLPSPLSSSINHQPKKSRLLGNFYASSTPASNNQNQNQHHLQLHQAAAAAGAATTNHLAAVFGSHNQNHNGLAANQLLHNQDSMHSTSSVDTQPSQCSSVVNSGSAGSPQPNSPPGRRHANSHNGPSSQRLGAGKGPSSGKEHSSHAAAAAALALGAMSAKFSNSQLNHNDNNHHHHHHHHHSQTDNHHSVVDLTSQSLSAAARQAALHQTLVRSLLQLKQNDQSHQDLLASLQQQNPRSLLESLASLSSAGTGSSVVDPASNSPTERTGTPPSGPTSPSIDTTKCDDELEDEHDDEEEILDDDECDNEVDRCGLVLTNNMALDLAKSSSTIDSNFTSPLNHKKSAKRQLVQDEDEPDLEETLDYGTEEEDDGDDNDRRGQVKLNAQDQNDNDSGANECELPLEGAKKVRKFLEDQILSKIQQQDHQDQQQTDSSPRVRVKRELLTQEENGGESPLRKRTKLNHNINLNVGDNDLNVISSISKSLIAELCDRRGDQLADSALNEAARYTECFLEILLDDASLIASHSNKDNQEEDRDDVTSQQNGQEEPADERTKKSGLKDKNNSIIDTSSLSLALKLIPPKLLTAIQQQVSSKSAPSSSIVVGAQTSLTS